VTFAQGPSEEAVGERAFQPFELGGPVVGGGDRVVAAVVRTSQELGGELAQERNGPQARFVEGFVLAQRRLGFQRRVVVLVADRQESARRGLQRALEEAAQVGEREAAARAQSGRGGGWADPVELRGDGLPEVGAERGADLAEGRELADPATGVSQRRSQGGRAALASVDEGVKRGFGDDDVGVLLKLREQPAGVEVRSSRDS